MLFYPRERWTCEVQEVPEGMSIPDPDRSLWLCRSEQERAERSQSRT